MVAAQAQQVVDVGFAAVVPGFPVVRVGPRHRRRTAWEAATLVPGVQRFAYPVRNEAVGAADLQGESGGRIEHASPYIAVAGDASGDGRVEVAEPVQPGRFGPVGYAGGGQRLPRRRGPNPVLGPRPVLGGGRLLIRPDRTRDPPTRSDASTLSGPSLSRSNRCRTRARRASSSPDAGQPDGPGVGGVGSGPSRVSGVIRTPRCGRTPCTVGSRPAPSTWATMSANASARRWSGVRRSSPRGGVITASNAVNNAAPASGSTCPRTVIMVPTRATLRPRRSNAACGSGSGPSGSRWAAIRSHACCNSAGVTVPARSARISSNATTPGRPTRSTRSSTLRTCSADTVPANAAARNTGRSPSSRARFTHTEATFGVIRPNDTNHDRAVRHASNSARSRLSKAPNTPAQHRRQLMKRRHQHRQRRPNGIVGLLARVDPGQPRQRVPQLMHLPQRPRIRRTHVWRLSSECERDAITPPGVFESPL